MKLTRPKERRLAEHRFYRIVGKLCLTDIVVPRTGRVVAHAEETLDEAKAREIAGLKTVIREIADGWLPGTILQESQAKGTGLWTAGRREL